jgi:hypothetical protein
MVESGAPDAPRYSLTNTAVATGDWLEMWMLTPLRPTQELIGTEKMLASTDHGPCWQDAASPSRPNKCRVLGVVPISPHQAVDEGKAPRTATQGGDVVLPRDAGWCLRRCDFPPRPGYAGSGSAAFTEIPLLRVRFQRAIGLLGWGASCSCPPEPFVHYSVGRGV